MIWWILSAVIVFVIFLLYACVTAGAKADRDMKEIMKNIRKKT